jgi:mono/diheme cytochrome c family protein
MVPAMLRLCAVLVVLALFVVGCGGDDDEGGSASTAATQTTTAAGGDQASAEGKQIFTENCAGCHTLADAGASGQSAPSLDELKPDKDTVARQTENGGGGMPAFGDRLSAEQIDAVATYVSSVAGQ